jgi:hypothetical protein
MMTDQSRPENIERTKPLTRQDVERAESKLRSLERQQQTPSDAQAHFRQEFNKMDSARKGTWGERVTRGEASRSGHEILKEHSDNPTEQGFDNITYDPQSDTVHIWEVKNWGADSHPVGTRDVTAWHDVRKDGLPRPGFERNWKKVVHSAADGSPQQDKIKQAVNEGRVIYHLRLVPDTRLSSELRNELETASNPGTDYDWGQYSYEDMFKVNI